MVVSWRRARPTRCMEVEGLKETVLTIKTSQPGLLTGQWAVLSWTVGPNLSLLPGPTPFLPESLGCLVSSGSRNGLEKYASRPSQKEGTAIAQP